MVLRCVGDLAFPAIVAMSAVISLFGCCTNSAGREGGFVAKAEPGSHMLRVRLTTRLRLTTPYSPRNEGEDEYYPVKLVVGPSVKGVEEDASRVFWAEQVGRIEERDPDRQYRAKISVGYEKIVVYLEWSDRCLVLSKETGYVHEEGRGAEALGRLRRQVVDMTVNFPAPQTDEVSEEFEEFQRKAKKHMEDREEVKNKQ